MARSHAGAFPGMVAILGSGEAAATGRRVLGALLRVLPEPRTVAVLDTPAGFQPNADQVAGKLVEFIASRLGELRPRAAVVRARRDDLGSAAGEAALAAIAAARCVVAGPGSPSYMIRQLADSAYVPALRAAHQAGAALYFASAAAVAMGAFAIPVYEIFKVGEDPRWISGLDILAPLGLRLAIVPHWNNAEGGAELDTSRCFLGRARFDTLCRALPPETVVLGIDEHTACVLDFNRGQVAVIGTGGVTLLRGQWTACFRKGETFPLAALTSGGGDVWPIAAHGDGADVGAAGGGDSGAVDSAREARWPADSARANGLGDAARQEPEAARVPAELLEALVAIRVELRAARQFGAADRLRDALLAAGIVIHDTPDGPRWEVGEPRR